MQNQRSALSTDNLHMLTTIASSGSMAAAARRLGVVPSALSYRLRQMEDNLDVLLVDRASRRAQLTLAGTELLRASEHLLNELDAVAQRVKRVATGWEAQLIIVADGLINTDTVFELFERFYELGAPTQLKLRVETMTGTTESLSSGQSDLALGIVSEAAQYAGVRSAPLGQIEFLFAVAPHHPLARVDVPLSNAHRLAHRAVVVADSAARGPGQTVGILQGQEVLTVPTMAHKLQAQLRGLGCGYLPQPLAQPFIDAGQLVVKAVDQPARIARMAYAWRNPISAAPGQALSWWLAQLKSSATRDALVGQRLAAAAQPTASSGPSKPTA
jgi:DNA-binding transcriptional LysR family regulator